MMIGRHRFKPTLAGTLAALALLPLLVSLGFWQLRRADEKRSLIDQFASGDTSTQQLHVDTIAAVPLLQQVTLHGEFDGARQVLLDNMPASRDAAGFSKPGYRVLTPMNIDAQHLVLIDRGWIPLGRTRDELPDLNVDSRPRSIRGRIAELPRAGIRMKNEPGSRPWPRTMNFPTLDELRALYGEGLLPRIVLLDPAEPDGFKRDWTARFSVVEFGPDKHIGYAVQWFGMALALVVIYVVVGLHRGNPSES